MEERMRQFLRRFRKPREWKKSFSQSGEDLILDFLFWSLGIHLPTYLDIGANHPRYLSNTYYFYRKGSRGVLVEPNPQLASLIARVRPRDVCANVAVGGTAKPPLDFYILNPAGLSTFDAADARKHEADKVAKIERVIPTAVIGAEDLIRKYCPQPPDLLSLDVEGMDFEILTAIDFTTWRPKVLCLETLTFESSGRGTKIQRIPDLARQLNYIPYADTYLNTIFVDQHTWDRRAVPGSPTNAPASLQKEP
jgi:FkbM family methyltransferase